MCPLDPKSFVICSTKGQGAYNSDFTGWNLTVWLFYDKKHRKRNIYLTNPVNHHGHIIQPDRPATSSFRHHYRRCFQVRSIHRSVTLSLVFTIHIALSVLFLLPFDGSNFKKRPVSVIVVTLKKKTSFRRVYTNPCNNEFFSIVVLCISSEQ